MGVRSVSAGFVLLGLALGAAPAAGQTHSALWGEHGEAWTPGGRLPDFSWAGSHYGEDPPRVPVVADVTEFGAVGDGETDCTAAFTRAIDEAEGGAVFIPPGRYVLSDILWITEPDLVLRGAGPGETTLVFTAELEDVRPNIGATTTGRPTSNYSWSGGFIWARGGNTGEPVAKVMTAAGAGARTLVLDDASGLSPGDVIEVTVYDDELRGFVDHIYAGDPGNTSKWSGTVRTSFVTPVEAVHGNDVRLARFTRFEIQPKWSPEVRLFEPEVTGVGVEDLAIEFPVKPYAGHFTELGMNAIAMNGVTHSWVRNVRISNCDSGIFLHGTFCTIDGVVLESAREPDRRLKTTGHHGLTLGKDCLLTNFEIRTRFIHDITVSNLSAGNVVKNGRAVDLAIDHHKRGPYANLFCNLDAGAGSRLWHSGGGADLGRNAGAWTTYWNIRGGAIRWPSASYGPSLMNFVGVETAEPEPDRWWVEPIEPGALEPADLHAAQRARRVRE